MQDSVRPRIAVLVDGDQHLSSLRAIREAAAAQGGITCAEVFADWDNLARSPWKTFAERSDYQTVQVAARTKNAVDEEMTRRVKEILAEGQTDEFWLASSDLDFIGTARLIMESKKAIRIVLAISRFPKDLQSSLRIVDPHGPLPREWAEDAARRIRAAVQAAPLHDGRALLSDLQSILTAKDSEFSSEDFGYRTLLMLLENLPDQFRVHQSTAGGAVFVEDIMVQ